MKDFCTDEQQNLLAPQTREVVVKFSVAKMAACHRALTLWLVKSNRPLALPRDPYFQSFVNSLTAGGYKTPNSHQIDKDILELSAAGLARLVAIMTQLKKEGLMPCISGDIWSEGGKALLGIIMHYISGALSLFSAVYEHFVRALSALPISVCIACH
jgi:hypothetical protein